MMRALLSGLILALGLAAAAIAAPLQYQLDERQSVVGFEADFGENIVRGQMPVVEAELTLDFDRVTASRVSVTLDARGAKANIPFATEAMKGETVLSTQNFPQILFESTAVRAAKTGATVTGNITIRGITHPVTLNAQIFRAAGTSVGERDNLAIQLTGSVSRAAFGATGFSSLVGDEVRLNIVAYIRRNG